MVFFLVIMRMAGLISIAPVFGRRDFFMLGKVAFIFWSSTVLFFAIPITQDLPTSGVAYISAMIMEFFVGFMIGFLTNIFLYGIEYAGQLMDIQSGLSVASLLDPATGHNMTIFARLMQFTALVLFLVLDGHHMVLSALFQSYKLLPLGMPIDFAEGALYIVKLGTYLFSLAVQLSAPILLIVFLIDFCFGMLNKVADNVNVFQLGFQIKPSVTMLVLFIITPSLTSTIYIILEKITNYVLRLFLALQV
ncbi:flagellar biosynthetic protein FliR [Thermoproteota archaeon]